MTTWENYYPQKGDLLPNSRNLVQQKVISDSDMISSLDSFSNYLQQAFTEEEAFGNQSAEE